MKVCLLSGPDDVPGQLLKEGTSWLANPLVRLFSLSLNQGYLPDDWTSANVTPVFKKGNKHLVANYRPISLTCTVVNYWRDLPITSCQPSLRVTTSSHLSNTVSGRNTHTRLNYWSQCFNGLAALIEPGVRTRCLLSFPKPSTLCLMSAFCTSWSM